MQLSVLLPRRHFRVITALSIWARISLELCSYTVFTSFTSHCRLFHFPRGCPVFCLMLNLWDICVVQVLFFWTPCWVSLLPRYSTALLGRTLPPPFKSYWGYFDHLSLSGLVPDLERPFPFLLQTVLFDLCIHLSFLVLITRWSLLHLLHLWLLWDTPTERRRKRQPGQLGPFPWGKELTRAPSAV